MNSCRVQVMYADIALWERAKTLIPDVFSAFWNSSPEAEALVAARAQERGLTPQEYMSSVQQRLTELTEMVMPLDVPRTDDPDDVSSSLRNSSIEMIVRGAVIRLKEQQIWNREQAIKALTYKHNLASDVARQARIDEEYARKALQALDQGNRELALQFFREKRSHEQTMPVVQSLLTQATEAAEVVKEQIRQGEERVRVSTTKAMLVEANLKAAAMRFYFGTLQDDAAPQPEMHTDFDAWVQSQR